MWVVHMIDRESTSKRRYLSSRYEIIRRHIRQNGPKAAVFGISVAAITAGFLSAAGIVWPLLAYIGIIGFFSATALCVLGLPGKPSDYLMLWLRGRQRSQIYGSPRQLELVLSTSHHKSTSLVLVNRCDDPVQLRAAPAWRFPRRAQTPATPAWPTRSIARFAQLLVAINGKLTAPGH